MFQNWLEIGPIITNEISDELGQTEYLAIDLTFFMISSIRTDTEITFSFPVNDYPTKKVVRM